MAQLYKHENLRMSRTLPISVATVLLALTACADDSADECGTSCHDVADVLDASDAEVGAETGNDVADAGEVFDGGADVAPEVTEDAPADTPTDTDADADAPGPALDEWPQIPQSEAMPDVDPEAWDPLTPSPSGEARGARVRAGQQAFEGSEARCRPGDFVLANGVIRACIAAENPINQMHYTGGMLIDLEPVDRPGGDTLETFSPSFSPLLSVASESVTLVRDGSDGGAAVVRAEGIDAMLKIVGNVVGNLVADQKLRFVTEYRLAPDDARLEAITWITIERDIPRQRVEGGDLLVPGDVPLAWLPGTGFEALLGEVDVPFYVATGPTRSYGVSAESMTVTTFAGDLLDAPISPTRMTRGLLGAGEAATYRRHFVVGDGSTTSIRRALGDLMPPRDGETVEFTREISEFDRDLRYELRSAEGSVDIIVIGDEGTAVVTDLPAGDYEAIPIAYHTGDGGPTAFSVPTDGPIALPAPVFGILSLTVTAVDGDTVASSPARVRVMGPATREHYVVRGSDQIALPPGTYTFEVSRGDEYDFVEFAGIEIVADETFDLSAELVRIWDTVGWVSGDMHQHSVRSIDSSVPAPDRVVSNLVAGVDFIAPTDHDIVENFVAIVDDLGAGDLLHTYLGTEISPVWGHINVFPLRYDPSLPASGAVPLSARDTDGRTVVLASTNELIGTARALGAEIVQINHPRGGTSGLLGSADYDPVTGPDAADPDFWPVDFDSMEVFNERDLFCEVFRDWTSLLTRGQRVAGVGNSDTHGLSSAAGYPRNFIVAPSDDPAELTDDVLSTGIGALNVSVSGGIFIDFPDGELPGEIIPAVDGEVYPLHVRVQTTAWSGIDALVVLIDGVEVERVDLTAVPPSQVVAFDDVLNIPIDGDNYVVLVGYAAARMERVTPGEFPFGFTNPLFFDDGDDGWVAPGVADESDVPPLIGIPFCD